MKWYRRLRAKAFLCWAFRLPWHISDKAVRGLVLYMLASRRLYGESEWPADVEATIHAALTDLR